MRPSKRPRSAFASRVLALASVAAVVVTLATLGGTASAATTFPTDILGGGSDVTFHVMSRLGQLYNQSPGCTTIAPTGTQPEDNGCLPQPGDITSENTNHDRISEAFPIGGSAGEDELCKHGLANVANVDYARQTAVGAKCTGLHYVAYGRDGITWESFPGVAGSHAAGVKNLTQAQLQGIFVNCTITNWNQVGGTAGAIKIYTILPQYGTRKAFDTFLGGSSSSCPAVKLIDQTNNAQITAADKPNAIVPVSVGSWTERYKKKPAGAQLGNIDNVVPSNKNIAGGSFPFSRFMYNVYCKGDPANGNKCGTANPAPAAVTRFIGESGWICKASVHAVDPITGTGYGTEIRNAITNFGFATLPKGATGGGATTTNYCRLFTS